jgi:hypothetical protein
MAGYVNRELEFPQNRVKVSKMASSKISIWLQSLKNRETPLEV